MVSFGQGKDSKVNIPWSNVTRKSVIIGGQ